MDYNKELLKKLGEKVESKTLIWDEVVIMWKKETGEDASRDALRNRYYRIRGSKNDNVDNIPRGVEFEKITKDGSMEAQKIVELSLEEKNNPSKLLKALGFDSNFYELKWYQCSIWDQKSKEADKQLYAIKYRIEPLKEPIFNEEEFLNNFKKLLEKAPTKYKFNLKEEKIKGLNEDKMLECPPVELHLGKLAWSGDSGENYDSKIAIERFEKITTELIKEQDIRKCGKLLLCVGGDFFNSDTEQNTTTKGTPQQNDVRWKKMFEIGVELYKSQIEELEKHFNEIEIRCVAGNHDRLTSYYLYSLLEARYSGRDKIKFGEHTREIQELKFGINAIFLHHGDVNQKRLIKSIAAEFPKLWGETKVRELHCGHFHKETLIDDDGGLIFRRVGSPTETDYWHYHERFLGAIQKHQLFIWDKNNGLECIHNINFIKEEKVKKYGI